MTVKPKDEAHTAAPEVAAQQLVASVSHELRNPLSSLRIMTYMLRKQPDKLEEYVSNIEALADQMQTLLDELLDQTALNEGSFQLQRERVVLQDIIADSLARLRLQAQRKGQTLEVNMSATALVLDADPTRLIQVIDNLVGNAIKYTPPGGCIKVMAQRVGDVVEIYIEDDGIGIPEAAQARIFEPFYRARNNTEKGTGLGLTITRQIVHAHGGTLRLVSAEGHGSLFVVTLPASSAVPTLKII